MMILGDDFRHLLLLRFALALEEAATSYKYYEVQICHKRRSLDFLGVLRLLIRPLLPICSLFLLLASRVVARFVSLSTLFHSILTTTTFFLLQYHAATMSASQPIDLLSSSDEEDTQEEYQRGRGAPCRAHWSRVVLGQLLLVRIP